MPFSHTALALDVILLQSVAFDQNVHVKLNTPLFSFLLYIFLLDKKADCTITMADSDLLDLMTGKMNPQSVSVMALTSFQ